MDASGLEKVEPDSPLRCQQVAKGLGQCTNKVVDGTKYCPIHIARLHKNVSDEKQRIYKLTLFRARAQEMSDHNEHTNLREEVGILRMTLESLLESCESSTDLLIHANRITDLTRTIQKIVADCHRIDKFTAKYLDKTAVLKLAGDIIDILCKHIDDVELLEAISNEITDKIINARPTDETD